jgi:predicted HicB family RNase H-like nuclease
MYRAEDYLYKVFWSDEDNEYVATVVEFPSLSSIEPTQIEALNGMVDLVRWALEDMAKDGEDPPAPLSKRHYSGNYPLRMTPEQHRRIATEAAEQGVSINQLLVSRI